MAALTIQQRNQVARDFMVALGRNGLTLGDQVRKRDVIDAVSDTDTWIDANGALYAAALGATVQPNGQLSKRAKALLFMLVAQKRYEVDT